MCSISPEQEWERQGHVQPLGLSEAHGGPEPGHHVHHYNHGGDNTDHHNNHGDDHHDHEVDNTDDQNRHYENPIMMIMMRTMVITILIMITKPLAKVASSAGARPWFASRLWTWLTFSTESLLVRSRILGWWKLSKNKTLAGSEWAASPPQSCWGYKPPSSGLNTVEKYAGHKRWSK